MSCYTWLSALLNQEHALPHENIGMCAVAKYVVRTPSEMTRNEIKIYSIQMQMIKDTGILVHKVLSILGPTDIDEMF